MEQYVITGMSCAACVARVEKAVNEVNGVESCAVSLLTNTMGVTGHANAEDIIKAVEKAGYGAELKNQDKNTTKNHAEYNAMNDEIHSLKIRLASSLAFWITLMYFTMGHMLWGFPLPPFLTHNHIAMGIVQLLLTVIIMMINQRFFVSGSKAFINRSPNMDSLVALGSGAAFVYSVVSLFLMTDAQLKGDNALVLKYMDELYFESAATILTLITVGKMLEAISKGKTTDALKNLMKIAPQTAVIINDNQEVTVRIEEVKAGDIFVVKTGEQIPVDGIIIEGNCAINESALTGESIPVDKIIGDPVYAATHNQSGFIKCEAKKVGEDTSFAKIIQMVSDAAATKAPIAKIADTVSGIFVPAVMCIALCTMIIWMICSGDFGYALARGIAVLVISCPCALGLATPVAIMVGNGVGAKNGILFKTAVSLEETGKIDFVVFDKTGTITLGEPKVTDIFVDDNSEKDELLALAYSLEKRSDHPLAKAVALYCEEQSISLRDVSSFVEIAGNGVKGIIDDNKIYGGNQKFIKNIITLPATTIEKAKAVSLQGKTPLFFVKNETLLGMIAVADVIKSDSEQAVKELSGMGINVIMLTGDNEQTAEVIAKKVGIKHVVANVLPGQKEKVINTFKKYGKVAMTGDGINDAPALMSADIGIAIGSGTDVAMDAADIVLMKNSLLDVPAAIRLSRKVYKNIKENLFWAFIYNGLGIPLAAGVFITLLGWELNPMFGAAAMSLSSFCVVTNALRINWYRIYEATHDKIKNINNKYDITTILNEMEDKGMEKTIKVEGMMCKHCEARVKQVLEQLDFVDQAVPNHETNHVVLTLNADANESVLKETIEAQDYKYLGME